MLGGLYGDLPPPSSTNEDEKSASSSVWSSSTKMAPPTLRKPPPLLKPKTLIQPKALIPSSQQQVLLETTHQPISHSLSSHSLSSAVIDEYDPASPNDYEEFKREKKRLAMEAERRREIERRRKEEEERERDREKRERERREREEERERKGNVLNISGEEAWRRRQAMSNSGGRHRSPSPPQDQNDSSTGGLGFSIGKSGTAGLGLGAGGQMTAAQKMMAKMGWKEGQGLGKSEQGITVPLVAKKTDRRAGVIVNASEAKKAKSASFQGVPTRVVLLRNMVGPGEVDDELEDEVASECSKYGTVTRVLIFEITEHNYPPDQAVRIFVQFERSEEATKALVDLEGRFFGGRTVRATFYSEDRFGKNELAPLPGEVPGF